LGNRRPLKLLLVLILGDEVVSFPIGFRNFRANSVPVGSYGGRASADRTTEPKLLPSLSGPERGAVSLQRRAFQRSRSKRAGGNGIRLAVWPGDVELLKALEAAELNDTLGVLEQRQRVTDLLVLWVSENAAGE